MNKQELIHQISAETNLSAADVNTVVSAALSKLSEVITSQGTFHSPLIHLEGVDEPKRGILRLPEIKARG